MCHQRHQIVLSGHTGLRANLMGEYHIMEGRPENGFPLYKKAEGHYIFREKSGKWMVAESFAHVGSGLGWIESQSKAELPTTSGLTWSFYDLDQDGGIGNWVPDGGISVTVEGAMVAPSTGAEYKNIVATLKMVIDRQP